MRFPFQWIASLALFFFFASGCTTVRKLTHIDCTQLDWFEIGRTDGSQGLPEKRAQEHLQSCVQMPSEGQIGTYENGYQAGLSDFCTATRGYEAGKANQKIEAACPWPLIERYNYGYQIGQRVRALQSQNRDISEDLNQLRQGQLGTSERTPSSVDLSKKRRELSDRKTTNAAEINRLENEFTSSLL